MEADFIIRWIAGQFGVQPTTLFIILSIIVTGSNMLSRIIPDDAVGFLATVRKVATVIGLYVPNRVSAGVTVMDAAKIVVSGMAKDPVMNQIAEEAEAATARSFFPPQQVEPEQDGSSGETLRSHWMIAVVIFVAVMLSGCMTIPSTAAGATQAVCAHREAIIKTAEAAIRVVQACPIIR
jgi:hypothetical protein